MHFWQLGERQRDAMVIDFLLFMAWYIFHKYVKPFVSWSFSHFHNLTFWSDKSMNWWTTVEMNIIFWCSIHCKVLTQQLYHSQGMCYNLVLNTKIREEILTIRMSLSMPPTWQLTTMSVLSYKLTNFQLLLISRLKFQRRIHCWHILQTCPCFNHFFVHYTVFVPDANLVI